MPGKILFIWGTLAVSYLFILAMLMLAPYLKAAMDALFDYLSKATYGLAEPTLIILLVVGTSLSAYYGLRTVQTLRGKPSAIHIASSTMGANMFGGEADKRARRQIEAICPTDKSPHIILMYPTDKSIYERIIKEVR